MSNERTGRVTTLLSTASAYRRGSQTIHAAEERLVPLPPSIGGVMAYPEFTALCGASGAGAAERPVTAVTCRRCVRTRRYQEVPDGRK